jgi:hypothetical protein
MQKEKKKVDIQQKSSSLFSPRHQEFWDQKTVWRNHILLSPVTQIIQPLTRRHLHSPSLLHLGLIGKEETLSLLEHVSLRLLLHFTPMRELLVVVRICSLIQLFPFPIRDIGDFAWIHVIWDAETAADALLGVWWSRIETHGGAWGCAGAGEEAREEREDEEEE